MKTCTGCGVSKTLDNFNRKTEDRLSARCKECCRVYTRRHYSSHKEQYKQRNKRSTKRFVEKVNIAKSVPCADCGVQYPPWVMQFDHLPGTKKEFDLGNARKIRSHRLVDAELAKCEVVCANCHADRTYHRRLPR